MELARELTARFHGAAAADAAIAHWHEVVQGGGVPQDIALTEITCRPRKASASARC